MSPGPAGTWQSGMVGSIDFGKGFVAPSCRRAMSCEDPRLPFLASMSAAMPDTMGAEKLVPAPAAYVLVAGDLSPLLYGVSMKNVHVAAPQFPPGALRAISGPRL